MTNGILLALIAYASYSGSDAVVKSLGGQLTIFEIGFFITLFAGFFLFFTRPAGERWRDFWRTKRPWAVQARACTAHGLLVRQKSRQRSPAGRVKNRKKPANKVMKKPISKIVS